MNKQQLNWDRKHQKYNQSGWINQPSLFAQDVAPYLQGRKILELGAGQGQDSRFFAKLGFDVTSTDFSKTALNFSIDKTPSILKRKINFLQLDLNLLFPFSDQSFDAVYAHLSLHYFDKQTTKQIFNEIYRVLKPHGIIALIVNSISDPEYSSGEKVEKDYLKLADGMKKRFFSIRSLKSFVTQFQTVILDDRGETHKDRDKGVSHLIRFIGVKG